MRYFGSKASTVSGLLQLVQAKVPGGTFCDPFGGIATVGAYFKAAGYRVFTGDQLRFATCFQVARIVYSRLPSFRRLKSKNSFGSAREVIEYLNGLLPMSGWFVREYAMNRLFFSEENAGKINAVRGCIRQWHDNRLITAKEHDYLVASLIDSADRVANTAGTYYAYLKGWHRKAKKPFAFAPIRPTPGVSGTSVFGDALDLVRSREFDVLYLDPPYNERCYAGYYHLPETLASGFRWRKVQGRSGIPYSTIRSAFNSRSSAADALRELVGAAHCKLLVFHYSDDGLVTPRETRNILAQHGSVRSCQLWSSGYTTKNCRRDIMHRVYFVTN